MKDRRVVDIDSRQLDHLRVFHDVARALTKQLDLEEILGAIMEKMAQFFGPERWSLLMVDEKAAELYYAIAVGENAESFVQRADDRLMRAKALGRNRVIAEDVGTPSARKASPAMRKTRRSR